MQEEDFPKNLVALNFRQQFAHANPSPLLLLLRFIDFIALQLLENLLVKILYVVFVFYMCVNSKFTFAFLMKLWFVALPPVLTLGSFSFCLPCCISPLTLLVSNMNFCFYNFL